MTNVRSAKLGILWRGDAGVRSTATAQNSRLKDVFQALAQVGISVEPVVYSEEATSEISQQLSLIDGVLVWVDPISDGRNRTGLDALLREAASRGVWVSAHPDVILKMGAKEVLNRTKHLGWGTDVQLYRTFSSFAAEFPAQLKTGAARVIKQNRGNGGQGVWKVQRAPHAAGRGDTVRVLEARRGSLPQDIPLEELMSRCKGYFSADGCIIDQPFQPRLAEGMIRCYVAGNKVVGFGHQLITALLDPPEGPDAQPLQSGPRIMHPASAPEFQKLRAKVETEWVPGLMQSLDIAFESLPAIWDADFLYGERTAAGGDTYVLCEINTSSVYPFPSAAPGAVARYALARLSVRNLNMKT